MQIEKGGSAKLFLQLWKPGLFTLQDPILTCPWVFFENDNSFSRKNHLRMKYFHSQLSTGPILALSMGCLLIWLWSLGSWCYRKIFTTPPLGAPCWYIAAHRSAVLRSPMLLLRNRTDRQPPFWMSWWSSNVCGHHSWGMMITGITQDVSSSSFYHKSCGRERVLVARTSILYLKCLCRLLLNFKNPVLAFCELKTVQKSPRS